jgi:hypothetical protein
MTVASDDALDDAGTAAGGAHTIVLQGLDANWDEQEETVTMDGTNGVVTSKTWIRVNRLFVDEIGTHSSGTNVGVITCTQTSSGNIEVEILAGVGQSFNAEWTVPLNQIAKIKYFWANIGKNEDAIIRFITRENGKAWRTRTEIKLYQNELKHGFGASITCPAKSDIKVQAKALTGSGIAISAGFFLEKLDVSNPPTASAPQS